MAWKILTEDGTEWRSIDLGPNALVAAQAIATYQGVYAAAINEATGASSAFAPADPMTGDCYVCSGPDRMTATTELLALDADGSLYRRLVCSEAHERIAVEQLFRVDSIQQVKGRTVAA